MKTKEHQKNIKNASSCSIVIPLTILSLSYARSPVSFLRETLSQLGSSLHPLPVPVHLKDLFFKFMNGTSTAHRIPETDGNILSFAFFCFPDSFRIQFTISECWPFRRAHWHATTIQRNTCKIMMLPSDSLAWVYRHTVFLTFYHFTAQHKDPQ